MEAGTFASPTASRLHDGRLTLLCPTLRPAEPGYEVKSPLFLLWLCVRLQGSNEGDATCGFTAWVSSMEPRSGQVFFVGGCCMEQKFGIFAGKKKVLSKKSRGHAAVCCVLVWRGGGCLLLVRLHWLPCDVRSLHTCALLCDMTTTCNHPRLLLHMTII
jgi:hypothetical protein